MVFRPQRGHRQYPGATERSEGTPGTDGPNRRSPEGATSRSVPHVPFVKFDLVLSQQVAKLLLERPPPVVLGLIADVARHVLNLGLADRKRPVSRLPREGPVRRPRIVQPAQRTRFQGLDRAGNRILAADRYEQMNANRSSAQAGSIVGSRFLVLKTMCRYAAARDCGMTDMPREVAPTGLRGLGGVVSRGSLAALGRPWLLPVAPLGPKDAESNRPHFWDGRFNNRRRRPPHRRRRSRPSHPLRDRSRRRANRHRHRTHRRNCRRHSW